MKKVTLLVASLLLVGSMAKASETSVFSDPVKANAYNYDEPIAFMERGIEFYVFTNGDFDFNTEPSYGETVYRTRRGINETYGAPTNGVRIEHDASGRVRRVGNVFINYDAVGRVKRIGSVYMSYNRYTLIQVGGLNLIYNRNGQIINVRGCVNQNPVHNHHREPYYNNNRNPYTYNDNRGNDNRGNDNEYYYRTNGKKDQLTEKDDYNENPNTTGHSKR